MTMNESLITDGLPKLKFAEAEKLCTPARHTHKANYFVLLNIPRT